MLWEVGENRVLLKIHSNTFFVLYLLISPTKSAFLWGKNFGGTRHLCEKDEPTLDRSVGGGGEEEHGKVCWLIVHYGKHKFLYSNFRFVGIHI